MADFESQKDVMNNSKLQDRKLKKALNTWDLYFLSLGGIIGSGWLFAAAASAGTDGPAAILSWLIGGIIVLFIALVYAELGGMIPRTGAISRYGHYSHGGVAGLFFGWTYFLSAVSVPAVEAEAVITYASSYINGLSYSAPNPLDPSTTVALLTGLGILLAGILIVAFFGLNYFGVRLMGKTNTGMTWWKLIIPSLTIVMLAFLVFHSSNFTSPALGGFLPDNNSATIFEAVSTDGIVFSFLGFRQALDYGGEAKTPQKSIPRATIFSVLTGIIVYVLLQVVFIAAINPASLAASGGWYGLVSSSPTAYAKSVVAAPFAFLAKSSGIVALVVLTYILYADAYVSPAGTLNVYAGTSTRTLFGLSQIGYFPKQISNVSKKTGIPLIPIIVSVIVGLIFLAPFPSWYALVGLITGATAFTYIVGGSALMVFRKQANELKRPFKLPFASILAPIAFVGATLIVYWSGWPTIPILAIAIFLGIAIYLIFLSTHKVENVFTMENIKAGWWVPVFILSLTLLSYLGEADYGGINILPYPLDFVVVIIMAIMFYLISINSGFRTEEIQDIIESGEQYIAGNEELATGAKK
ncbi:MAG: APC family permease [Ferroplasma sp.]